MNPKAAITDNPTLSGAKFRQGHKATVVGILGARAPEVHSRGSRFYNVDRWTARVFTREMCLWAKQNPQCIPTPGVVAAWVRAANNEVVPKREIVIANTPDTLTTRTAMALMGGAYHEAFHTHLSCLRSLSEKEMVALVIPRWAKVPDWSKFHGMLQNWSNVIEDIRIERRGREEFPGCEVKLHDLQDLILGMEHDPKFVGGRTHDGKSPARGALSIILCTFRDVGLGYNTPLQRDALAAYRQENEKAVEFVIGRGKGNPGPLMALLKEAISLPRSDDTGCLRLAMEVIGHLYDQSSEEDPANDPNNPQHQPGAGQKSQCPKCGAPGSKLVIRPKANGNGGKVQGVGILTCSVCGHQEEVLLQNQKGSGKSGDPRDTPKFEGFDKPEKPSKPEKGQGAGQPGEEEDEDTSEADGEGKSGKDKADSEKESPGSGKGKSGKDKSKGKGKDKPSKSDSDEDEDGEGSGADGDGDGEGSEESDDGEGSEDGGEEDGEGGEEDGKGDEDGNGGEEDDTEGEGSQGDSDDAEGSGYKVPDEEGTDEGFNQGDNKSNTDADVKDQSAPGGGHNFEEGLLGNDWSDLTNEALTGTVKALDANSALEGAVAEEEAQALKEAGGVKTGEALWKPYDPALDEVLPVQPSHSGKDHDADLADRIYSSVRTESSYLRSRFRQIIRAMEMTSTVHGTPKGRRLSSRFLVDSKVAIMSGQMPKRAYKQVDEQLDTSLAAAIVLDQSGSMCGLLRDATRILCAITEPLDALGCPVQVSGFRDGCYYGGSREGILGGNYHRTESITHDVFKAFHEPLRTVKWRFANTRATGGTPMADGVQFGLQALNHRTEGHRILFVVTDGQPNGGHMPIIRRQLRLAKEAGIHVVGVGIGSGAQYVKQVFPDSVWSNQVSELPAALIAKLNQIIDKQVTKRGARMAG